MGNLEIKQGIEKIIDGITKEDVIFLKDFKNAQDKQNNIANFFKEQGNILYYKNASNKINASLEKYINENQCDEATLLEIKNFINILNTGSEQVDKSNQELIGNKLNLIADKGNINLLLKKENTSFGDIFEKSSEAIKSNLISIISSELLNDEYLSKEIKNNKITERGDGKMRYNNGKRELTDAGEEVKELLLKEVSKERSDNMTFGLLDAIINKVSSKWEGIKDNKEKMLEEKGSLLITIQKLMKNGGLSNLQNNNGVLKNVDASRNTIQSFQNNFKLFLKEKVKEAGFNMTDKNTKKQSIIDGSKYSVIGLALSKNKKNETIKEVVGKGFKEGFSYFNNYENTKVLMQSLISADANKKFDIASLPKTNNAQTTPTEKDMQSLVSSMNELAKDMPTDPTSKEAQQVKEKIMNSKMDKILGNLGPMKDIVIALAEWINNIKGGKGILAFLTKSLGLKEGDIQKLLDRPYIKNGIDNYKEKINDGIGKTDWKMELGDKNQDWKAKTTYFRLSNNIVYRKDDKNNRLLSQVNDKGEVKNLDPVTDKKIIEKYPMTRKDHIEDFIMNDMNSTSIVGILKDTLDTKFGNNAKKQNALKDVQNTYFTISPDGKNIIPKDDKIKNIIKSTLENNSYIYSTDDLIGAILENGVKEVYNTVDIAPTIKIEGKKDILIKKGASLPSDISSWINIDNVPQGTTYILQNPSLSFTTIPEKAIVIVTIPGGQPQNVEVTFKEDVARALTNAKQPAIDKNLTTKKSTDKQVKKKK